MAGRLKIYELAKELEQDSRQVVEVVQRLGINIKNPTSFIGSEEARIVRDYYRRMRTQPARKAPAAPTKGSVTERRVGRTVIRRRSRSAPPASEEAPSVAPEPSPAVVSPPAEKTSAPSAKATASASVESTDAVDAVESTAAKSPKLPKKLVKTFPAEPAASKPEKVPSKPEVTEEAPPEPVQAKEAKNEAEEAQDKKRWKFPSIIKKVATEKHLGDTIGPKQPRREVKPSKTAGGKTEEGTAAQGPKRVREIDVASGAASASASATRDSNKRRIQQSQSGVFRSADYLKRELVRTNKKKKAVMNRPALKTLITTPSAKKRVVEMEETITVEELARKLGVKVKQVVEKLRGMGVTPDLNEPLDHDTATLCASEFEFTVKQVVFREEDYLPQAEVPAEDQKSRAPVVTIMGHVDHGKTSVLDKIRKANVAEGEAGGITQHIGAYTVKLSKGDITFVDTPGHEAFTAMRARGAKVTDIVILVVSGVDGVMPQTIESISHAKAAGVPIIVAINKMDLPEANADKVKQALASHELAPEEWGGDTLMVNVSAKTGKGLDDLLENILLHAELLELKAAYKGPAIGVVLESRMEKGRGAVATLLVQSGKLKVGDSIVMGTVLGKVRAISDFKGKRAKEAGPSEAAEIIGLPDVVTAGEPFHALKNEKSARDLVEARKKQAEAEQQVEKPKLSLEEMLAADSQEVKELKVVLKSDVQGSVEAVQEALSKFPQEKVQIRYLHKAVGGITESDIMLASASQGVVFGFNVRPDGKARTLAEREGVDIRCYRIIYELVDEVKKLLEGLVDKKVVEKVIGRAEVRDVFNIPKIGAVAGSSVVDGKISRGCFMRLLRDSRVVYEGKVSSLRRFKDDVREVTNGYECGIGLENFNDIKAGDQLEAFEREEVAGTL